jgi:glutamate N-acetyltransferase/amino-acid N-acetyltransferase
MRPRRKRNAGVSLAPKRFSKLPPISGVRLATAATGIRYSGRADLLFAILAPGTQVAGVFTQSKCASAPVAHCRANRSSGEARALVVNSGNANAFTGRSGISAAKAVAEHAAAAIGAKASEVFLASTGIIGEPLPTEKITRALPRLASIVGPESWRSAAEAIMTTDTWPKLITASARIDGAKVTINGIAKGSGMIAPDMATLLAFVFTDANVSAPVLQDMLNEAVAPSFNSITVDGDTSTSDTLLLFATRQAAHACITNRRDPRLADFRQKLNSILLDLALQIVRDGEGARKLITVEVKGAQSAASARKIALSIANSPLVKTAIAGSDANWGRVVMAVGKAGEPADPDRLRIWFGRELVAANGARARSYNEKAATKAVSGPQVTITVELGLSRGSARVYTCDLTDGYIRINGSYRT